MKKIYKRGFTLAEVLITLVIIGIIAAITVPSLMNNLNRNELRSQFNKAVSVTSQAIQKMKLDYGDIVYSDTEDSGIAFRDRFMSYFSVICKENCLDINKYKNFANQNDSRMNLLFVNCFTVQDGMTYCLYKGVPSNWMYITIDINGSQKKPNRWGYDTFTFYVDLNNQILRPFKHECSDRDNCRKCDKNATSNNWWNGAGCASKAITEPDYFKNI